MARANETYIELGPLKGQNSTENPLALGPGWATRTLNVQLDPLSSVATKRNGSVRLDAYPNNVYLLHRHLPNVVPTPHDAEAELWAFALSPGLTIYRKVGSAAWSAPITVPGTLVKVTRCLSFNGKLYMAGTTLSNRMHLWDGTVIRQAGLVTPGTQVPTVTGTAGSGPPAAVTRYYKVSWVRVDTLGTGQITGFHSELTGASLPFTNTAGACALVTRPLIPAPTATHWIVWGSLDNVTYRQVSGAIEVATQTYTDCAHPNTYAGAIAPPIGTNMPLPAATRIITDGNRLLMSGWGCAPTPPSGGELPASANRVWYTPILGTGSGDDERIPLTVDQRNYVDIGETTLRAAISELAGPMDGQVYVFQRRRIWRMVPTGDLITPYLTYPVSDRYGAIAEQHQTTGAVKDGINVCAVPGENQNGQPAVYFLDRTGVYRISNQNVEFVSYDITTDYDTSQNNEPWLFSYPEKKQLWLMTATLASGPRIFVFQMDQGTPDQHGNVIGGWVTWEHAEATQPFGQGVTHNRTPGTVGQLAEAQVPYLAVKAGAMKPYTFDDVAAIDGTTSYIGAVTFAPILASNVQRQMRVGQPQMVARSGAAGHNLTCTAIRDFGVQLRSSTVDITPNPPAATSVVRTFDGLFDGDVTCLELALGDNDPKSYVWRVDFLTVPTYPQEPR